jgi:hypothetical protein
MLHYRVLVASLVLNPGIGICSAFSYLRYVINRFTNVFNELDGYLDI